MVLIELVHPGVGTSLETLLKGLEVSWPVYNLTKKASEQGDFYRQMPSNLANWNKHQLSVARKHTASSVVTSDGSEQAISLALARRCPHSASPESRRLLSFCAVDAAQQNNKATICHPMWCNG